MYNLFSTLGIGEKENVVSNLFAYWFDYNQTKDLSALNALLTVAGKPLITDTNLKVIREKPISKKENRYDVIVLIGENVNHPDRVICIENKINAQEGQDQTKRYYDEIESKYSNATTRDYIFLAKDNSCLKLSDMHFKHVKYISFAKELNTIVNKSTFAGLEDFMDYYWKTPEAYFSGLAEKIITDSNEFIDYLVWYNNINSTSTLSLRGISDYHSSKKSYQIDLKNLVLVHNKKSIPMNIHLEGDRFLGKVHYETQPYVAFSSLDKEFGRDFQDDYSKERNRLRDIFISNVPGAKKPRKDADLTLCNIVLSDGTYEEVANEIIKVAETIRNMSMDI